MKLRESVEQAWQNRELLKSGPAQDDIRAVIEEVDKGRLRVAEPTENGWQVNEWVKQAILMYFFHPAHANLGPPSFRIL